ncbi:MAG: amidohydrolase family protein [Candidatus Nitrosocaldaceae archaeon]
MLDTLITNASIVLPTIGIVRKDLGIKDGKVAILTNDKVSANKVIDAKGRYVIPGVIDPHVHYGVFEPIERAAAHESRSAAIGGVTCMMRMLRLYSSYKKDLLKHLTVNTHLIDYVYHASILLRTHIEEIGYCKEHGIRAFKLYMNLKDEIGRIYMDMEPYNNKLIEGYVNTYEFMNDAIEGIIKNNAIAIIHAEDPDMCIEGIKRMREMKRNDLAAWSDARAGINEKKSISFLTNFINNRCQLYLPHIGSKEGLEEAISAKRLSRVYIETCPHYLTHTMEFDLRGKVTPPLRSKDDQAALWNAIRNGMIDCIGSDHVANRLKDKIADNTVWNALAGFPGIATILPVMLSEGVNKGRIDLKDLTRLISYNASRIFSLKCKGNLEIGYDADLVIIDLEKEVKVTPEILNSYSDYTIYDGITLKGWPILTMVRGEIIMEDGAIVGKEGYGRYVS